MEYDRCPSCNSKRFSKVDGSFRIKQCRKCKAIFGECYLGESYSFVMPWFDTAREFDSFGKKIREERYFDFTCLGSEGITRRHGWYNPETKGITQIG